MNVMYFCIWGYELISFSCVSWLQVKYSGSTGYLQLLSKPRSVWDAEGNIKHPYTMFLCKLWNFGHWLGELVRYNSFYRRMVHELFCCPQNPQMTMLCICGIYFDGAINPIYTPYNPYKLWNLARGQYFLQDKGPWAILGCAKPPIDCIMFGEEGGV